MDPITLLIVCPLVFLAMLVDAIAGGGGLISLTAYLVAGLPPHVALGTNKVSSAIGTVVATVRFAKSGLIKIKLAIPAVIFALAGSAIGAKVALHTPDGVIQMIMVFALPVVAFFVLRKRALDVPADATISTKKQIAIIAISSFFIGMYDGFYGPGTGTFMLLAFTAAAKLPVREANGEAKCANLASNVAALVTFTTKAINLATNVAALAVFLVNGAVLIPLGLAAAAFNIAGNWLGSTFFDKKGALILRPIMLVVLALLFVKVLYDLVF